MAISINQNYSRVSTGNKWKILAEGTLDALYPVGGYTLDPKKFGLDRIESLLATSEDGYVFDYDFTSKKLVVLRTGDSGSFFSAAPFTSNIVSERLYYTGASGSFLPSETVTGGTSAATATVVAPLSRAVGQSGLEVTITAGAFAAGEVITGSLSGVTATLTYEAIIVYDCPFPVKSIACVLDGSTLAPLTISAYQGAFSATRVRLQPGNINPLNNLPSFWEAERPISAAPPTLLWCYGNVAPELSSNLYEVAALTDLSGVTVDFEVTGV